MIAPPLPVEDLRRSRRRKEPPPIDLSKIDRLPPHSNEVEQALLGSVLLDDSTLDTMLAGGMAQDWFYDLRHGELFQIMVEMKSAMMRVDPVAIYHQLLELKKTDQLGGMPYIISLMDACGSTHNTAYYLKILRDKYRLRRMLALVTNAAGRIYNLQDEAESLLDQIEREVLAVRQQSIETDQLCIRDVVQQSLVRIEEMHDKQGAITGLPTGLVDLDKLTDGLHPGEMTVIAAYPSGGKTALAMNIVEHTILESKLAVGVFSLEMPAVSLATRMLCSNGRVNLKNIRDGVLQERDFHSLTLSAGRIAGSKLHIHSASDLSIHQLRAIARRMKHQHDVKLIVVDYLQLLNGLGGPRTPESRQQEVAEISRGVKGMSVELGVPVLALSQLNDDGKLRESRAIGQDADGVWILTPDWESGSDGAFPVSLKIDKQRNGPRDTVSLTFLSSITRFECAAKVAPEDVPKKKQPRHNDE